MSNIMSKIIEWGTTLPLWEQLALRKILEGEKFTDDTFNELLELLLEEAELTDSKKERTQPTLEIYANRTDSQTAGKALLHQVSNLKNINALVSDQKLEFGERATVIFGENGSGKSGYARLIASAAFTRGDKEILRNVKKTFNETDTLSADIYLKFGDTPPEPIHHIVGQPCPDMHTFYVFDSTSVKTHLTKANSMSFAPSNLDIFTKLAEVTDEVRKKLSQKIEQVRKPPINIALFEGESDVSKEIETLSSKTDESKIIALGRLSEEETQRISDLDKQIAELKSTDFPKLIANIDQKVKDLKTLIISLESTGKKLDYSIQKNIHETIESWGDLNTMSSQLSIDAFKTETLLTIGSPAWYEFAKAGLSLAITESTKAPYPSTNSVCLLCHQPLSTDAHDHLHRLWELLRNDTQKKIEHLEERLETHRQSLLLIDFDFFNDQSVSYRLLSTEYQSEMNLIEEFLSAKSIEVDCLLQFSINALLILQNCLRPGFLISGVSLVN